MARTIMSQIGAHGGAVLLCLCLCGSFPLLGQPPNGNPIGNEFSRLTAEMAGTSYPSWQHLVTASQPYVPLRVAFPEPEREFESPCPPFDCPEKEWQYDVDGKPFSMDLRVFLPDPPGGSCIVTVWFVKREPCFGTGMEFQILDVDRGVVECDALDRYLTLIDEEWSVISGYEVLEKRATELFSLAGHQMAKNTFWDFFEELDPLFQDLYKCGSGSMYIQTQIYRGTCVYHARGGPSYCRFTLKSCGNVCCRKQLKACYSQDPNILGPVVEDGETFIAEGAGCTDETPPDTYILIDGKACHPACGN